MAGLAWLIALACCTTTWADSEVPCWSGTAGGYQAAVFQSPSSLRVGRGHFSLLVQNAFTHQWVSTARVSLRCAPHDRPEQVRSIEFRPDAASNRLLQTAAFDLPETGWWEFEITIDGPLAPGSIRFASEVAPAPPRWFAFWPWFSWPLVVIVLFGSHQWLIAQSRPSDASPRQSVFGVRQPTRDYAPDGSADR